MRRQRLADRSRRIVVVEFAFFVVVQHVLELVLDQLLVVELVFQLVVQQLVVQQLVGQQLVVVQLVGRRKQLQLLGLRIVLGAPSLNASGSAGPGTRGGAPGVPDVRAVTP